MKPYLKISKTKGQQRKCQRFDNYNGMRVGSKNIVKGGWEFNLLSSNAPVYTLPHKKKKYTCP